jgi:hypothetical protein
MIKATLFRQFYTQKEYKVITVSNISEIQKHCTNGWKCINYSTTIF